MRLVVIVAWTGIVFLTLAGDLPVAYGTQDDDRSFPMGFQVPAWQHVGRLPLFRPQQTVVRQSRTLCDDLVRRCWRISAEMKPPKYEKLACQLPYGTRIDRDGGYVRLPKGWVWNASTVRGVHDGLTWFTLSDGVALNLYSYELNVVRKRFPIRKI